MQFWLPAAVRGLCGASGAGLWRGEDDQTLPGALPAALFIWIQGRSVFPNDRKAGSRPRGGFVLPVAPFLPLLMDPELPDLLGSWLEQNLFTRRHSLPEPFVLVCVQQSPASIDSFPQPPRQLFIHALHFCLDPTTVQTPIFSFSGIYGCRRWLMHLAGEKSDLISSTSQPWSLWLYYYYFFVGL